MVDSAIRSALAKMQSAVKYDAKRHAYTIGGVRYDNVTSIGATLANRALIGWAGNLAVDAADTQILEWSREENANIYQLLARIDKIRGVWNRTSSEAKDLGTEVHALIQHETHKMLGIPSEAPTVSDEARHCFSGWSEWAAEVHYQPLAVEFPVYSPAHKYAGRVDVLASIMGGSPAVLDWKTTGAKHLGKLWPDNELQSLAYRAALREHGIMAEGWIVQIPKESGSITAVHVPWSDAGLDAFIGLQRAYAWMKGRK